MTNKIINGIDVSECYADNKMMKDGLYCFWEGGNCADNEFCYFKQLKRLQEENEELKKYQYTQEYLQGEIEKRQKALEEIRENIAKLIAKKGYAEIEEDFILTKTIEVLNDTKPI